MSNRNKQDWGCLHWFLLAFAILAVAIVLLVMLASPSKDGGSSPCQSMLNEHQIGRSYDHFSVVKGTSVSDVRHIGTKPGPGSGAKPPAPAPKPAPVKPAPVKPNLTKQGPAKPSKAPSKPSKRPKVDVDLPDCD